MNKTSEVPLSKTVDKEPTLLELYKKKVDEAVNASMILNVQKPPATKDVRAKGAVNKDVQQQAAKTKKVSISQTLLSDLFSTSMKKINREPEYVSSSDDGIVKHQIKRVQGEWMGAQVPFHLPEYFFSHHDFVGTLTHLRFDGAVVDSGKRQGDCGPSCRPRIWQ